MNRAGAIDLVRMKITALVGDKEPMVVLEDRIIERDWGWFVPWMARVDAEAGNPPAPGIAPFIVLRSTREIHPLFSGAFESSVLRVLGERAGEELLAELA